MKTINGRAVIELLDDDDLNITGTFDCKECGAEIEAYFDTPAVLAQRMQAHEQDCEVVNAD